MLKNHLRFDTSIKKVKTKFYEVTKYGHYMMFITFESQNDYQKRFKIMKQNMIQNRLKVKKVYRLLSGKIKVMTKIGRFNVDDMKKPILYYDKNGALKNSLDQI